jgi:hypothetical protein
VWQPRAVSLQAHRFSLAAMATGPSFLLSSAAGGSVKLTGQGAIRAMAQEAGIKLPR